MTFWTSATTISLKRLLPKKPPASRGALSGLISALIERKITVEIITANEPAVEDTRERNIRFDISCRTESGEQINIEMCFNPRPNQRERLEYYAAKLHVSQGIRGIDKEYSDLKETYQIALLDKERLFPDDAFIHTFLYHDSLHSVQLEGKTRIIIVELLKTESIVSKEPAELETREAWAVFFQYLTDISKRGIINEILQKEAEIGMAGETLFTISQDERERARLLSEEKYILDKQNEEVHARRRAQAERRKGHAEGMQEGERNKAAEIARNLKAVGISADIIFQTTGLHIEDI